MLNPPKTAKKLYLLQEITLNDGSTWEDILAWEQYPMNDRDYGNNGFLKGFYYKDNVKKNVLISMSSIEDIEYIQTSPDLVDKEGDPDKEYHIEPSDSEE